MHRVMKHLLLRIEGGMRDERFVLDTLLAACDAAKAHVRRVVEHSFYPDGYSVLVLLAESHATVHTWPEQGFALVDYFSCAKEANEDAFADVWFMRGFGLKSKEIVER